MEIWESLLVLLLIPIVVSIAFSLFWYSKVRGEKKILSQDIIRTRPPKMLSGFFLGFALSVVLGGIAGLIYCCIEDSENTTISIIIIISVGIAAFSSLGFFGYLYTRFNYVVASSDGIFVFSLFRKKRYYSYSEIGYFQDTTNLGMLGGLIGYDKKNLKIFTVEGIHIGVSAVIERLRENGVPEKSSGQFNLNR